MSMNCNYCGLDFDGPHRLDVSGEAVHPLLSDCIEALRAEVERLEAELARLRPVVEAAKALDSAGHDYAAGAPDQPYCSPECPKHLAEEALSDAVDALRAEGGDANGG